MKRLLITALLLGCSLLYGQNHEIARESNLLPILNTTYEDSIMYIERMAALKFNRLLNEYRQSKEKDTLRFNNELWLAARNHTIYMNQHSDLSHEESQTNSPYFTGKRPGERLNFVQTSKKYYNFTGENCLVDEVAAWISENKDKSAETIAQTALELWKKSKGHNENMLSGSHESEGTAFIINQGTYWATTIFGRKNSVTELYEQNEEKQVAAPPLRLNIYHLSKKITQDIQEELKKKNLEIQTDSIAIKAAEKHAIYIAKHRTDQHIQTEGEEEFFETNPPKRYAKIKYGKLANIKPKPESLTEVITVGKADEVDFDYDSFLKDLYKKLLTKEFLKHFGTMNSVGIGVHSKRYKKDIETYIVILLQK